MDQHHNEVYALISQVRKSYNLLKSLSEQLLQDLDVNPSKRAVIEHLSRHGACTVATIAKHKNVSRQHIQIIMNALEKEHYVIPSQNPSHKRSPYFQLSEKGGMIFNEILRREAEPLTRLANSIPHELPGKTAKALEDFNDHISKLINDQSHQK
jgi:DNA-binding MarR family transcriptional regulator